jgi:hypothetical protein
LTPMVCDCPGIGSDTVGHIGALFQILILKDGWHSGHEACRLGAFLLASGLSPVQVTCIIGNLLAEWGVAPEKE